MIILPAVDIIDGSAVRLYQGDYGKKKVYDPDPSAVACRFRDAGAKHIHIVDLDGALHGESRNFSVIFQPVKIMFQNFVFTAKTRSDCNGSHILGKRGRGHNFRRDLRQLFL